MSSEDIELNTLNENYQAINQRFERLNTLKQGLTNSISQTERRLLAYKLRFRFMRIKGYLMRLTPHETRIKNILTAGIIRTEDSLNRAYNAIDRCDRELKRIARSNSSNTLNH